MKIEKINRKYYLTEMFFTNLQKVNKALYPQTYKLRIKLRNKFNGFVGYTLGAETEIIIPANA